MLKSHSSKVTQITFRHEVAPEDIGKLKNIILSTELFTHEEVKVAIDLILERIIRREHSGYHFLLAEEARNTTIGFSCFGPIACTKGSFDLYWIAVHAHFQNRGIGSLLLKKSEKEMAGMGSRRIFIETSSQSRYDATRRFYEKHGYKIASEIKGFYSNNDNKIIYEKINKNFTATY